MIRLPCSAQAGLSFFGQSLEGHLVVHGQVGKHLAVNADHGALEAVDNAAVRQTVFAGSRVDALNPQAAEVALALAAVTVAVLAGLDDSLLGYAKRLAAGTIIALGPAQHLAVAATGGYRTFYSCHDRSPLKVWQQLTHAFFIGLADQGGRTQADEKSVRQLLDRKSTRLNSSHVAISY